MRYYNSMEDVEEKYSGDGHGSYNLLDEKNGCVNSCMTGISYYRATHFTEKAYHDFQEGFYVISGSGSAKVGEEEFPLKPGLSFIVPEQTAHQLKSDSPEEPLYLFWFHAK